MEVPIDLLYHTERTLELARLFLPLYDSRGKMARYWMDDDWLVMVYEDGTWTCLIVDKGTLVTLSKPPELSIWREAGLITDAEMNAELTAEARIRNDNQLHIEHSALLHLMAKYPEVVEEALSGKELAGE